VTGEHLEKGSIKLDNFIVSAFVTSGSPYEVLLASQLLPSLDKIGLKYHIEVMENRGSWLKNVAQKPLALLHTMEKYPSFNVVSLDADCEVFSFPKLFTEIPEEYDMALHILDWDSWYQYTSHVKEVLSGTVWVRNNEKTRQFVKEWYLLADTADMWEQKCLQRLIDTKKDIKIFELPLEYCYIKTLPDGKEPHIKIDNPVILHHQASRKFRKQFRK
jgi:hypothetical protein